MRFQNTSSTFDIGVRPPIFTSFGIYTHSLLYNHQGTNRQSCQFSRSTFSIACSEIFQLLLLPSPAKQMRHTFAYESHSDSLLSAIPTRTRAVELYSLNKHWTLLLTTKHAFILLPCTETSNWHLSDVKLLPSIYMQPPVTVLRIRFKVTDYSFSDVTSFFMRRYVLLQSLRLSGKN